VADLDFGRADRLVDGVLPAKSPARNQGARPLMSRMFSVRAPRLNVAAAPNQTWLRAMPAVFVLIWSTGFIVARYGMPHAPPFSFLALRYAVHLCFLPWIVCARALAAKPAQWLHLGSPAC
jgi:hypothetical protein